MIPGKSIIQLLCGACFFATSFAAASGGAVFASDVGGVEPTPNHEHCIAAAPGEISFSSVPVGSRYSQAIRLTNLSRSLKTVNSVTAVGAGLALEPFFGPLVLSAGESISITVDYRPTRAGGALGKVTVFVKDEAATEIVVKESALGGNSRSDDIAVEGDLEFGKVPVGTTANRTITLRNNGKRDIQIGNAAFSDSSFTGATSSAVKLAPGQDIQVDVQFSPTVPGSRNARATIGSSAGGGSIQIEASGEGVSASDHKIGLRWQPSDAPVQGYFVYRGMQAGGPFTKLNGSPLTEPEYTDEAVAAGQEYFYVVTSVDEAGVESSFSAPMPMQAP